MCSSDLIQTTANTGEKGTQHEGHALVMEQAHAHSLSSDFILTDGLKGTALGGINEAGNKNEDKRRY